jgi:hypothetical protein
MVFGRSYVLETPNDSRDSLPMVARTWVGYCTVSTCEDMDERRRRLPVGSELDQDK